MKTLRLLTTLALATLGLVVPQTAQAAVVKTTAVVYPPAYIYAGVANPIDVAICAKTSLSAKDCYGTAERKVTLWADGKQVQTLTTTGGGGVVSFNWVPARSGKVPLKVSVAAAGSLRAVTSEPKTVTVKAKVAATKLGTVACGSVCVSGIPSTLNLNKEEVITAAITSGSTKNRKIHFQTLRTTNRYVDEISGTSSWQSDVSKYGYSLSFAQIDGFSDCTPGETVTWNFRFYVDATAISPGAATAAKWIDIICPTGTDEKVQLEVTYEDQLVDYDNYNPDKVTVLVTAPDTTQYSVWLETCLKSTDCSNSDNWTATDGYSRDDEIFGSQQFTLNPDPGDYGVYWLRVAVIPWVDGQDEIDSDWYTLDLRSGF